jgi:hypothetical protein
MADSKGEAEAGNRRYKLARLVVFGAFCTIFLLVSVLVALGQLGSASASQLAEKTFNSILPVLAGWVGTVLAFYFSAQSLERTSNALDNVVQRVGAGGGGGGPNVTTKMIPRADIRGIIDITKQKPTELSLGTLKQMFVSEKATRLVFIDDKGAVRYVLHEATLNAYLAKGDMGDKHFSDLLADSSFERQIASQIAFVSVNATLRDAKEALDKVSGAQDIIVTSTGQGTDPLLGWLTNVDLIRALDGA